MSRVVGARGLGTRAAFPTSRRVLGGGLGAGAVAGVVLVRRAQHVVGPEVVARRGGAVLVLVPGSRAGFALADVADPSLSAGDASSDGSLPRLLQGGATPVEVVLVRGRRDAVVPEVPVHLVGVHHRACSPFVLRPCRPQTDRGGRSSTRGAVTVVRARTRSRRRRRRSGTLLRSPGHTCSCTRSRPGTLCRRPGHPCTCTRRGR